MLTDTLPQGSPAVFESPVSINSNGPENCVKFCSCALQTLRILFAESAAGELFRATLTQAAGVSPLTLERMWVYKEQLSISFFHQFGITFRAFTSMICIFLENLYVLFPPLRSLLFSGIPVMDYYIWALSMETVTVYCSIQHIWG